jgi:hypothetical protein
MGIPATWPKLTPRWEKGLDFSHARPEHTFRTKFPLAADILDDMEGCYGIAPGASSPNGGEYQRRFLISQAGDIFSVEDINQVVDALAEHWKQRKSLLQWQY